MFPFFSISTIPVLFLYFPSLPSCLPYLVPSIVLSFSVVPPPALLHLFIPFFLSFSVRSFKIYFLTYVFPRPPWHFHNILYSTFYFLFVRPLTTHSSFPFFYTSLQQPISHPLVPLNNTPVPKRRRFCLTGCSGVNVYLCISDAGKALRCDKFS